MPDQVELGCPMVLITRPTRVGGSEANIASWRLLGELENGQIRLHDEAQLGKGENRKWKAKFLYAEDVT